MSRGSVAPASVLEKPHELLTDSCGGEGPRLERRTGANAPLELADPRLREP